MRNPFKSKFKVTQAFGVNAAYYSKFGLKGHEGIDLIPTGTVWDVLSLADGIVVRDENNARSGPYGIYVTIFHPTLKKATQYCHLASNTVAMGQKVKAGEKLGTMGRTGNVTGAHLHLNLFNTDANGIRLGKTNGYLGGINPMAFLEEIPTPAPKPVPVYNDVSMNDQTKIPAALLGTGQDLEIQQIRGKLTELERAKTELAQLKVSHQENVEVYNRDMAKLQQQLDSLEEQIETLSQETKTAPIPVFPTPQDAELMVHGKLSNPVATTLHDIALKLG